VRASQETRKAIEEMMERLAETLATKDINAFMQLFTTDANMVAIGPEEEAMLIGQIQLKQQMEATFKEAESISLKYGWTSIKANGPVAWLATHVYYTIKKTGKQAVKLSTRLTGVLEQNKDKWAWVQYHFSVPLTIEAPEETPEEKAASEAAAKEKAEAEVPEAAAKSEEVTTDESPEEDIFYEMP
jgi:uncharacterized protein (TIGR02246 family)